MVTHMGFTVLFLAWSMAVFDHVQVGIDAFNLKRLDSLNPVADCGAASSPRRVVAAFHRFDRELHHCLLLNIPVPRTLTSGS